MDHLSAYQASLEAVAAVCEDVVPPVYAALFAKYPDYERLFVMDTDHGVRGHMLNEAIGMAEGLLEKDATSQYFVSAARMNHEGYGVPEDAFAIFYTVMADVFRDLAGEAWSEDMSLAWRAITDAAHAAEL